MSHGASAGTVQYKLWGLCPDYYYKVHVTRSEVYNSDTASTFAGYMYRLTWDDYRIDVPQTEAINEDMSFGGVASNLPTFTQSTEWDAAQDHLFFNPAPYEWFYTAETEPQVTVTVDGKLGACKPGVNCNYKRVSATPRVSSTATTDVNTNPVTITVTGTDFSTTAADYAAIEFGGKTCTPAAPTATSLSCDVSDPVAGDGVVKVRMVATGYVEAAASRNLAATPVLPTVSAVSPTSINGNGGQTLTITGTRFFTEADRVKNTASVTVDGQPCTNLQHPSVTEVKCDTPSGVAAGTGKEVKVTINGQEATSTVDVVVTATTATVSPTAVAMNTKTDLTITISGLGGNCLTKADWTAQLTQDGGTNVYPMKVNAVAYADPTHTLTVRYPGAAAIGTHTLVAGCTGEGTVTRS